MAAQQPPTSRRVDPSDPTFLQRLADDDARVTGYAHVARGHGRSRAAIEAITAIAANKVVDGEMTMKDAGIWVREALGLAPENPTSESDA